MASITKYRGSTWRAIVRKVGFKSESKTFDTKVEATRWATGIESAMDSGKHRDIPRELNHTRGTKTEAEVLDMLNEELANLRRIVMVERLHQRYNSLRVTRERIELFKKTVSKSGLRKIIPNGNGKSWMTKVAPPEPEEQANARCRAGFVVSKVSGIADEMKRSLVGTLEKLIASIDEQQATIKTLKAINQELKSASEELRSAKVELQLLVEENVTVNSVQTVHNAS